MEEPEYLTAFEAAKVVGCAVQTLAAWRRRGFGPVWHNWGRRMVRYPRRALEVWVRDWRMRDGQV